MALNYSFLDIPEQQITYDRGKHISEEVFFSLLCNGILNVCQLLQNKEGNDISIPINPECVDEKLVMQEILADISLVELLSSNSWDRTIFPSEDSRNTNGETITPNNCRIFSSGSYSVFDIDNVKLKNIPKSKILHNLYESIKSLYGDIGTSPLDIHISSEYFINIGLLNHVYGKRILKKVREFQDRYDNNKGKELFLRQISHSEFPVNFVRNEIKSIISKLEDIWFDKDLEKYNNFIATLKNIEDVFLNDSEALENYLCNSKKIILEDIAYHTRSLIKNLGYFKIEGNGVSELVKEILLNNNGK
ncbi:MAG: hypothetical protein WC850_02065 [Candidatus Gracilibacteria bacterium]